MATTTTAALVHGTPQAERNDRLGSGKYAFPAGPVRPEGLTVQIYDDGRIKIGAWRAVPVILAVRPFEPGPKNGNRSGGVPHRASGGDAGSRPRPAGTGPD